jgi:hypothetical protein
MNFDRYISLIVGSVAEQGYDNFMPSMCIAGDSIEMSVLDGELSLNDDGQAAKNWASEFAIPGRVIFLAYRTPDRTVTVVEITGRDVTSKHCISVIPNSDVGT